MNGQRRLALAGLIVRGLVLAGLLVLTGCATSQPAAPPDTLARRGMLLAAARVPDERARSSDRAPTRPASWSPASCSIGVIRTSR
jgi:hypothetical protein